jgi:hypothetical protein
VVNVQVAIHSCMFLDGVAYDMDIHLAFHMVAFVGVVVVLVEVNFVVVAAAFDVHFSLNEEMDHVHCCMVKDDHFAGKMILNGVDGLVMQHLFHLKMMMEGVLMKVLQKQVVVVVNFVEVLAVMVVDFPIMISMVVFKGYCKKLLLIQPQEKVPSPLRDT